MRTTKFSITKVVTRNVILDLFANVRNFFGYNLTPYEDIINKTVVDIHKELDTKYKKVHWYRQQIDEISNQAVMITIYGEAE